MRTEELFSKRGGAAVADAAGERYSLPPKARAQRRGFVEDFADDDAGEFLRAPQRVKVRKSFLPETKWGWIAIGVGTLIVVGSVVGTFLGVRGFLMHDERFRIASSSSIQVLGNSHVTRPELLTIFGEDIERNIFHVSLKDRKTELEKLPWVERATVMRLLPDRIRVSVVERTPVAFVRQGGKIGLVDAQGVLLDLPQDTPGNPQYSFPVVTGISVNDPATTRSARMKIYEKFVGDLDSSGSKISEQLSEVDISNPEDVKALIPDHDSEVLVHFGDDQFLDRYQKFEQHLPEWKLQYPKLASADMRYEQQVVLEMSKDSGPSDSAAPKATNDAKKPDAPVAAASVKPAVATAKTDVAPVKKTEIAKKPVETAKTKAPAAHGATVDTSSGIPNDVAKRLAGPNASKSVTSGKPAASSEWKMTIAKPGQVAPPSKDLLSKPVTKAQPAATQPHPLETVPQR